MTAPRTVIVGSALPLLILVGLVGMPSGRIAADPERPAMAGSARPAGSTGGKESERKQAAAAKQEALALTWLRRSIRSGRDLGFSGTEVVTAWHPGGSTTQVLTLTQRAGGVRTAIERGTSAGTGQSAEPLQTGTASADVLAGLSERALDALAAGYELRVAGRAEVAGRATTVVVASRDDREAARMWLDDETGLLLRQDVLDQAGKLHRMAAFLDLRPAPATRTAGTHSGPRTAASGSTSTGSTSGSTSTGSSTTGSAVNGTNSQPVSSISPNALDPAALARWRSEGWPCPEQLGAGYLLLDARRETAAGGSTVVHLTYGDGLSAISVFLQRGQLDDSRLTGLSSQKWGNTVVHVRPGWPEVLVWQGGRMVITAVGDAEPADLKAVLNTLPRQPDRGTLGSIQDEMGSAFAWFTG